MWKTRKKRKKKRTFITALMLTFAMILTTPATSYAASSKDFENIWENTGDKAEDITQIALGQAGYRETNNHTKYNVWYYGKDVAAPWCAIFISWCADQAGISTKTIRKNAVASGYNLNNMTNNSFHCPAYAMGKGVAKKGDIAYIDQTKNGTSNHVGLVYKVDSNYVYTVEGNYNNRAALVKYNASTGYSTNSDRSRIVFFARPDYEDSSSVKEENYKVTADTLTVRSNPNISAAILGYVKKETTLKVTQIDGKWGKIAYKGKTAWVSLSYCRKIQNTSATKPPETESSLSSDSSISSNDNSSSTNIAYKVNYSYLNVRSGPSVNYDKIGQLRKGDKITVTEEKSGWGKFTYNGKTAWVSLSYCKKESYAKYKVTASTLTIRSGAGTSYPAIGYMKNGSVVQVTETKGKWAHTTKGWMSLKYLQAS